MANREFQVIVQWDAEEQVWVTHVPALNDLSTWGATRDEALDNTREAILGYIEAAGKEQLSLPGAVAVELVQLEVATA
jgi:predicted RNase H-like HicB family nuclease